MTANSKDQADQNTGDTAGDEQLDKGLRKPVDQGGHAGMGGHGGQQSGGMGGMHGGDLHDVGAAQSGMTGGAGMGGNDRDRKSAPGDAVQGAGAGNEQRAEAGGHEIAEVQQSAQREGMGQHRQRGRDHTQDEDATDAADLGSRDGAAAEEQDDNKP